MVEEKDLYRIFEIKKGGYAGEYKLYFNRKVAEYYLPSNINIYKWGDISCLNAEPGDYIEAFDGAVVILLRKRIYRPKKKITVPFYFFRFPMCTITAYDTKSKGFQFREFYGQMTYLNKNRILSVVKYGTDNQKVRFASMIVMGIHPFKAYKIAFGIKHPIEIATLHRRINSLMSEEVVREEIKLQAEPLIERLNEEFPDDRIIKELSLLLQSSRKGSDAHRENIKFIMALLNKLPDAMYPHSKSNSKRIAVEAEVINELPPTHMLE